MVSGVDDNGDPVMVYVERCGACGALIVISEVEMADHYATAHPIGRRDRAS